MSIAVWTLVAAAYLLGSFPTGVILARGKGVDLRQVGSGNVGATNVGRALGRRWALLVLLVDALKGFLPVYLAVHLALPSLWQALVGLAAILGHVFSVFLRGRGGKGVATALGVCLCLAPLPALLSCLVYLILLGAFRISSVGSLAALLLFPAFYWLLGGRDAALVALGITNAILITFRHRANLSRLRRGEELKSPFR